MPRFIVAATERVNFLLSDLTRLLPSPAIIISRLTHHGNRQTACHLRCDIFIRLIMSTSDEEELVGGPPLSINPYEVLGLGPEATHEEVKSAYRKLALRNHPGTSISFESQSVLT